MKKKIGFLVFLIGFTVYILGVFHPTEALINNVAITAPKNTIFTSIRDNGESIDYFILPFVQKNQYSVKNNEEIKITISSDPFHKEEGKIIFVKVKKVSPDYFGGYVEHLAKKREIKKVGGQKREICKSYFFLEDSNINYLVFHAQKDIYINIISSVNIDDMIVKMCQ